ncbi:hypothetical protein ACMFMF_009137 [Clarireedia jacksonii]
MSDLDPPWPASQWRMGFPWVVGRLRDRAKVLTDGLVKHALCADSHRNSTETGASEPVVGTANPSLGALAVDYSVTGGASNYHGRIR